MNNISQTILVASNVVLAAAVSIHVLKSPATPATAPSLTSGVTTLNESVNDLGLALQRFNTTSVQSDYLHNEIARLANLDQGLGERINFEKSRDPQPPTVEAEKRIQQLEQLQAQVQKELKGRRMAILQVINGLERQLGAATVAQKGSANVIASGIEPKAAKTEETPVPSEPTSSDTAPE